MNATNQIRAKLLELEGGIFQRLCDDWLHRKGYDNINAIGMMKSTDRVTKGTPDCLFIQPDGFYVFSEYTVQQDRLVIKLEDDINKCFDEQKTGIKNEQISEIIICYLGKLSTHEINHLTSLCQKRNTRLSLNGLDSISLSIQNCYPILSEQYLALPLDTGQLLPVDDFIIRYGRNNLTTSIDNKILFQDDLIKQAMDQLEQEPLLLVSGAAGVGKTLFSVNLVKAMQENNSELKIYCLFDKGADLTRDITAHLSEPGDYLIFVDDANRLDNRLDYILHYLNEYDGNRTFRIIATVRDYAHDSIINQVSKFTNIHEQYISSLTDEQVKELTVELFGIHNGEYQQRIQEISGGNARLAMMASKVAVETNQINSIQNVASLYDDYFGQNENIKEVVENEKLMAAACAISFFRKVDKLNNSHMDWVQNSFGISPEEFWEYVGILHKNELVDLYEDEVVKISDQVLSTYLFYLSVFEKKIIPFSLIVNDFYPDFKRTIVDALNPVISAFDHKKIVKEIRCEIEETFKVISESRDIKKAIEFLNSFWFALPTETLIFAKKLISAMPCIEDSWENESFEESKGDASEFSLISLLSNFKNYGESEFKMSFDLLLQYLSKNKESLGYIIKELTEKYSFKSNDWRYGYYIQAYVVDTLIEKSECGNNYLFSKVFSLIAKSFLKIEYREHQWSRGDTINIITFRLAPDEYLIPIRQKLIANLSVLQRQSNYEKDIQEIFSEYLGRLKFEGKEMAEADFPFIKEFIIPNFDTKNTSHCLIMQDLCDHLDSLQVEYPEEWRKSFISLALELANLLLEDRQERKMLDMGYEEYNEYRYQCVVKYFEALTKDKFTQFMEQCISLFNALSGRERDYCLKNGIEISLKAISETHTKELVDYVLIYMHYDDIFEINPFSIISNLFKTLNATEVWKLINSKDYRWKKYWCSFYFSLLPEESITKADSESLLEHLSNTPSNELRNWLDFLSKYQKVDKDIYIKSVSLLVNKSKEDKYYAKPLGHIFSTNSEIFGAWFEIFKSDEKLIFDAYLAVFKIERYWDYKGEALDLLTKRNSNFLNEIVDSIYGSERWPDSHTNMPELVFLWQRDDFIDEIEKYGKYVYHKEKDSYGIGDNIFYKLFLKEKGKNEAEELIEKKQLFIKHTILNNTDDIKYCCFIFNVANNMGEDFRRELLSVFIQKNHNYADFQTLDYELTTRSWSGSRVPILEREKSYLISILPLFNSVELLEHRVYVEEQIERKVKSIEWEKKRDFLESRH
ncbi:DNA replication protein [Thalassotalea sp. PLHSN55]|uniref:nSTAND3 domain-containing NTPase n=1 Tax=Thalassotalea sp. PLHSN55 TaxID=3435888 RepID=UPI003F855D55